MCGAGRSPENVSQCHNEWRTRTHARALTRTRTYPVQLTGSCYSCGLNILLCVCVWCHPRTPTLAPTCHPHTPTPAPTTWSGRHLLVVPGKRYTVYTYIYTLCVNRYYSVCVCVSCLSESSPVTARAAVKCSTAYSRNATCPTGSGLTGALARC